MDGIRVFKLTLSGDGSSYNVDDNINNMNIGDHIYIDDLHESLKILKSFSTTFESDLAVVYELEKGFKIIKNVHNERIRLIFDRNIINNCDRETAIWISKLNDLLDYGQIIVVVKDSPNNHLAGIKPQNVTDDFIKNFFRIYKIYNDGNEASINFVSDFHKFIENKKY